MFPDPSVVLYACVCRANPTTVTILADFNPGNDPDIEASAVQCLQNTPPHHATFCRTSNDKTYAYLIDNEIVFFGIFDAGNIQASEEGIPLRFLNRVKQRFDGSMSKRKNRALQSEYRGLQSAADELFLETLGLHKVNSSKGVKSVCVRFLGFAMCVLMKKRKKGKQGSFGSDAYSECALVPSTDSKQGT